MTDAFSLLRIASLSLATGVFAAGALAQAPATGSTARIDFRPKHRLAKRLTVGIRLRLTIGIAKRLLGLSIGQPVQPPS